MSGSTDETTRQSAAFLSWLDTLNVPITDANASIETLYRPSLLWAILETIDPDCSSEVPEARDNENDDAETRKASLEQLLQCILKYYKETLHLATDALPPIDTDSIASEESEAQLCRLLSVMLAMAVLSPTKEAQVLKIQSRPEWVQRELMLCIENVRSKLSSPDPSTDTISSPFRPKSMTEIDFAEASFSELRAAHQALQQAYSTLQTEHKQSQDEHEETLEALREMRAQGTKSPSKNVDIRQELHLKIEVDRLRQELSRTEVVLAESETQASKQEKMIEELTKRLEEVQAKADEADRLKDQVDEYRHTAEKLRKVEAQNEKYRKKLDEAAEARQMLQTLEDQNVDLLEKNSQLEEEYRKVSAFQGLMDTYKAQIEELEGKNRMSSKQLQETQYKLDETERKLQTETEEVERVKDSIALLEERIQELEITGRKRLSTGEKQRQTNGTDGLPAAENEASDTDAADLSGMANEMDDAVRGTTTTQLKLEIRRLRRELQAAQSNKADASKIEVLQHLLDESQKMKARYVQDYLSEHREKLVALGQLEQIRAGRSDAGDGAQAAIALRMRLNEAIEDLDQTRLSQIAAEQKLERAERELVISKSNLALVDKDQLDILASLRASVSVEKDSLQAEVTRLTSSIEELSQKNAMQLSQINSLLLDKVNLQSDGLSQREKMLERLHTNSTSSPKQGNETDLQINELREALTSRQSELDQVKEKLQKARNFIRQQDKLFKEQHAALNSGNLSDAAEQSYKIQVMNLEEELDKQRSLIATLEEKHQKEQQLMLQAWQEAGIHSLRSHTQANGTQQPRAPPASWLAQQRARTFTKR